MSLFSDTKHSLNARIAELELLLRQSSIREEQQKSLISSLMSRLDVKFCEYPVFLNPRVRILQDSLNSVMAILQTYQATPAKYPAHVVIRSIKETLSEFLIKNKQVLEEERRKVEMTSPLRLTLLPWFTAGR